MSDSSPTLEMDIAVALSSLRKARKLIEDNADRPVATEFVADGCGRDAATLRQVYSLILDASAGVAGAGAVLRLRGEMAEALATPPTPLLRLVKP